MKELVLIGIAYLLLSRKTGGSIFGVPVSADLIDEFSFQWSPKIPENPLLDEGWIWEKGEG